MQQPWQWEDSYDPLVTQFISKHFGRSAGITRLFPYMKPDFKWKDKKSFPPDARVVLKNNNEYHGLERHAKQYHLSGMYQEAYEFWLIAAAWRHQNMKSSGFTDDKHLRALAFTIQNACFNEALAEWHLGRRPLPLPGDYDLSDATIAAQDKEAMHQINEELVARGMPAPYPDE